MPILMQSFNGAPFDEDMMLCLPRKAFDDGLKELDAGQGTHESFRFVG